MEYILIKFLTWRYLCIKKLQLKLGHDEVILKFFLLFQPTLSMRNSLKFQFGTFIESFQLV